MPETFSMYPAVRDGKRVKPGDAVLARTILSPVFREGTVHAIEDQLRGAGRSLGEVSPEVWVKFNQSGKALNYSGDLLATMIVKDPDSK